MTLRSVPPPPVPPVPPVLDALAEASAAVAHARESFSPLLPTAAKAEVLRRLSTLGAEIEALTGAVMVASGDVAEEAACRDVAAWMVVETGGSGAAHRRRLRVAEALDRRWARVAEAYAAGALCADQVEVIVRALDRLPASVGADVLGRAEATLLELAGRHPLPDLRQLGDHVLTVLAPEIGEEVDRKALLATERAARAATRFRFRPGPEGCTDVEGRLPTPVADRLKTLLDSFAAPRRRGGGDDTGVGSGGAGGGIRGVGEVDRLPYDRRLGEAFCALLERLPTTVLPKHGGTTTHVVVNLDLSDLLAGTGFARLSTGGEISAEEARRLACSAGVVPMVLGGEGEVLDLGRQARLFSRAQHDAMVVRDGRCRAAGCDLPPAWCEAHHLTPWSRGGRTDLADGVLLCAFHHHRAHDDRFDCSRLPNGDVRFVLRV